MMWTAQLCRQLLNGAIGAPRMGWRWCGKLTVCRGSVHGPARVGVSVWLRLAGRSAVVPAGIISCRVLREGITHVHCRGKGTHVLPSRLVWHPRSHDHELRFDWSKFWEVLRPDLLLLALAVAVRETLGTELLDQIIRARVAIVFDMFYMVNLLHLMCCTWFSVLLHSRRLWWLQY